MSIRWIYLFIPAFLFCMGGLPVHAAQQTQLIRISEVMAAPDTGDQEWVELTNISTQEANLTDWALDDIPDGGSSPRSFSITIPAHGYVVIETVPILNNGGDDIRVLDAQGKVVDMFSYNHTEKGMSWARGDLETDEFCLQLPSKGQANDRCMTETPSPTPSPSPTEQEQDEEAPSPSSSPTPMPTTPAFDVSENIYLSEVMVAPETGEHEWVELYNTSDNIILLVDWYLDDTAEEGSQPKKITAELPPHAYTLVELSTGIFNNSGDSVRLLDPNENEVEEFAYTSSKKGSSWGKTTPTDTTLCQQNPSPGEENNACTDVTEQEEENSDTTIVTQTSLIGRTSTTYQSDATTASEKLKRKAISELPQSSRGKTTPVLSASHGSVPDFRASVARGPSPYQTQPVDKLLATGGAILETRESTHASSSGSIALTRTLSFSSFSFSLTALISLVVKMARGAM